MVGAAFEVLLALNYRASQQPHADFSSIIERSNNHISRLSEADIYAAQKLVDILVASKPKMLNGETFKITSVVKDTYPIFDYTAERDETLDTLGAIFPLLGESLLHHIDNPDMDFLDKTVYNRDVIVPKWSKVVLPFQLLPKKSLNVLDPLKSTLKNIRVLEWKPLLP